MRVQPEVSKLAPTTINLGNGVLAPEFDVQSVQTTVAVNDGETIVIGGLIAKTDTKNENKIPWFGDLPYVGAAFRYRTQAKNKTELLIILTPHIVRSKADADRILFEESRRMDWIVGDVLKTHGTSGMAPAVPTPANVDGHMPLPLPPASPALVPPGASGPGCPPPAYQGGMPAPLNMAPADGGTLPAPRTMPPAAQGQVVPANPSSLLRPMPPTGGLPAPADAGGRALPQSLPGQATTPTAPSQEDRQWTVMPNK